MVSGIFYAPIGQFVHVELRKNCTAWSGGVFVRHVFALGQLLRPMGHLARTSLVIGTDKQKKTRRAGIAPEAISLGNASFKAG